MTPEIQKLKSENEKLQDEVNRLREQLKSSSGNRGKLQKSGMAKKAALGNLQSRVPFGYKLNSETRQLIPSENFKEVEEIFEEFLNNKISLRKLAEKHKFSVNGLKKILTNFTYIGKIKFNNQIFQGNHKSLVSTTLFNHVQNKLERLNKKE